MMSVSHSSRLPVAGSLVAGLRLVGGVLIAGLLVSTASSAAAQSVTGTGSASCSAPILDLANPNPGDMLQPGGYVIQGTAYDPEAQQGSGIDSVSIFLDDRGAGGTELGQAVPGSFATPAPPAPAADMFTLTVTLPSSSIGVHSIVAYAHSSLTGQETVVSVPIVLGEDPSQAGVVPGSQTESNSNAGTAPMNCAPMPSPSTVPGSSTAPATSPVTSTPSTSQAATAPTMLPITLQVANPQPGDTVLSGAYVISGIAADPNAQSGTGIASVSIFLDERGNGGLELAQFTPSSRYWTTTITLPDQLGQHSLYVYADSAVNNAEASVSVPFTLDQ